MSKDSRMERLLLGEGDVNAMSRAERILEGTFVGEPQSRVEKLLMEGGAGSGSGGDNVEFATDAEIRQIMDEAGFGG